MNEETQKPDWLERRLQNLDYGKVILIAVLILFAYSALIMYCPQFH
ncbi:MAG: hypothetical protein WC441_01675 [Patescibacteria group bacterium]